MDFPFLNQNLLRRGQSWNDKDDESFYRDCFAIRPDTKATTEVCDRLLQDLADETTKKPSLSNNHNKMVNEKRSNNRNEKHVKPLLDVSNQTKKIKLDMDLQGSSSKLNIAKIDLPKIKQEKIDIGYDRKANPSKMPQNYKPRKEQENKAQEIDKSLDVMPTTMDSQPMTQTDNDQRAFQVLYGKHKPYKKVKEWTNDGFAKFTNNIIELYDVSGKRVARSEKGKFNKNSLDLGFETVVGGWEIQIDAEIKLGPFLSGDFFITD